ncbi:uncharacterized protein BYT42DRAFT_550613 [Radiomyces spectabilis]|uniref:uncharacterized protein n=1 Tax=Radiomyces spectabilis TaxID=64574 RepID=UPI002220E804|nr:uncharacterized protein BYT42DRAFT_550613 [Radiomyces spectabilis]KAI8393313.1 hypothetical protein BYT42DRAFT_550613 [Radiomyces spectabilis]
MIPYCALIACNTYTLLLPLIVSSKASCFVPFFLSSFIRSSEYPSAHVKSFLSGDYKTKTQNQAPATIHRS